MKKLFTLFVIVSMIALSLCGCGGNNSGNDTATATPRPLALRNEILQTLQVEYKDLKKEYDALEDGNDKKAEISDQMKQNLEQQTETINGINGEENFNELSKRVKEYIDSANKYNESGDVDKVAEILEMVNVINYGNKEGEKTW